MRSGNLLRARAGWAAALACGCGSMRNGRRRSRGVTRRILWRGANTALRAPFAGQDEVLVGGADVVADFPVMQ